MTLVIFTKTAAGPAFGPYLAGDVVDVNATDLARMQAGTEPTGIGVPAVVLAPANAKATKKGT
jgi:hypothetical protein